MQTTIQDTYQIQLQTDIPDRRAGARGHHHRAVRIPTLQPGQSGTFNVTITNHGLIAAQGVTLDLPTDPEYTFTALTTISAWCPPKFRVVPVTVTRDAPQSLSISDGGTTLTTKVVVPNPVGRIPPPRCMWIIPTRAPWPCRRRCWC